MTAHTAGPWVIGDIVGFDQDELSIVADGGHGATICAVWPVGEDFDEDEGRSLNRAANARLIAAAPDLLAALQVLLASDVYADAEGPLSVERGGCDDADHREIVKRCHAAIAKATGAPK